EHARKGARSTGLGQAYFRCSPVRVLRQELPSAFTNHSQKSSPREEEGTSRKGLDLDMPTALPKVLNQGTNILSHQEREIWKEKWCSKDWRRMCSTSLETKERVCPHTQTIQGVDHTTVDVEILKAVTGALAQEKQSLLPKNVITKEHPYEGRKRCQKAKMKAKLQEGRISKPTKARAKARQFHPPHKTPKEILALDKGKFKPPPSMTTPVVKRNASKLYEFHGEVGHTTDECMHLKWQIEEMLKAGKLSHLIKELKQSSGKDQAKAAKGKPQEKEKPLVILMVQSWQSVAKQKITQTFFSKSVISFPPLGEEDRTEGPMIIEAVIGGNFVHRISQMIPATTPLVGFSGEIIWPLGQISLLVKIGDEEHSTSSWMNFIVVRSPSPYNGIIGRPRVRRIHAVPSKAHGMLKFPVEGKTVTLRSKEGRKELCGLLRRNLDIFAWKPVDKTGIP
nr:hypothetical protein [Tanacetum cinerariifolium]